MSLTDVLFRDLHADDLPEVTIIPSLCLNCHEDGETKLLLTRIPFFRDVIVSSFKCEECGYHNSSIDSAGRIQNKGIKITLQVKSFNELNRKMVQGKNSVLKLLDSEFPVSNGVLTTIEGAIDNIITNLQMLQDERRKVDSKLAENVDNFIKKLEILKNGETEFSLELYDPSGNSIIENPVAPKSDPLMKIEHFVRTSEQNEALGITDDDQLDDESEKTFAEEVQDEFKPKDEVVVIPVNCPKCNAPTETRMKMLDIPHFKEVIIMATDCSSCGLRENEVKGGCGIAEKGQLYELKIEESVDLARDLLKSETANIQIPELDITTSTGEALGGRFTTVEGILRSMADQLLELNPFIIGDSTEVSNNSLKQVIDKINAIADGKEKATLIMKDPAGNSYIQDIYSPEPDPRLLKSEYERVYEENDDLGLNNMVTENYAENS